MLPKRGHTALWGLFCFSKLPRSQLYAKATELPMVALNFLTGIHIGILSRILQKVQHFQVLPWIFPHTNLLQSWRVNLMFLFRWLLNAYRRNFNSFITWNQFTILSCPLHNFPTQNCLLHPVMPRSCFHAWLRINSPGMSFISLFSAEQRSSHPVSVLKLPLHSPLCSPLHLF